MGGASVVGYLKGDPNSLHNSIYDFSIGSKQPNSNQWPLFFKMGHSIGLRHTTPSSPCQDLHPNPKMANKYV